MAPRISADVRKFHELGVDASKRTQPAKGATYRHGIAEFAAKKSVRIGLVYHAIRFARYYTLEEVVAQNLQTLTVGHFRELVLVKDAPQRKKLARQAVEQGWSTHQLKQQRLREAKKPRSQRRGGRPVRHPASLAEAQHQIAEKAYRWLHWHDGFEIWANTDDAPQLPKVVARKLHDVRQAMDLLVKAVERHMS
jgi:hypothetical protein